jgi:hypothetical protein
MTINGENIEQVKSTNFLGIIIDECLTWNDHITKVAKKIIRASGIIAIPIYIISFFNENFYL